MDGGRWHRLSTGIHLADMTPEGEISPESNALIEA